jgi:hypothetical protein
MPGCGMPTPHSALDEVLEKKCGSRLNQANSVGNRSDFSWSKVQSLGLASDFGTGTPCSLARKTTRRPVR